MYKGTEFNTVEAKRGQAVEEMLSGQMSALKDAGLGDCKVMVFRGRETTSQGLALALSNALRLYRAGDFTEVEIP